MDYLSKNLLPSERVVYSSTPHWIIFSQSALIFVLAFIFYAIGSGLPVFFGFPLNFVAAFIVLAFAVVSYTKTLIFYKNSEYGVTNKRVIMKEGWLQERSFEIFLDKIEGIYVNQSFLGRVLNYGNIVITGTGGTQDSFGLINQPLEFRKAVEKMMGEK